jgi:hypothetical protein
LVIKMVNGHAAGGRHVLPSLLGAPAQGQTGGRVEQIAVIAGQGFSPGLQIQRFRS